MPPKDPIVAPIASHDRIDFPMTTSTTTASAAAVVVPACSPVSQPPASLVFQQQRVLPSYEHVFRHQQHKEQQQPPATSNTTSLLGQHSHQLPTSFCLLQRPEEENEKESTEIPVFLAFLNKLHSGELQQQLPLQQATNLLLGTTLSVVTTTTNPSSQSKSISIKDHLQPQQQRKTVQFAQPSQLQTVYPVLSRHDMSSREIQNTWYTEHYLRTKGQVQQQQEEDGDDYSDQFHHSSTALSSPSSSSSSSSLKMSQQNHTRNSTLTGMYIRRARRVVLGEQARLGEQVRQDYFFLHNNDDNNKTNNKCNIKEERIRGAYHKVTLHCSREAKARGEAAAKLAAKLS
jgi:hypothetical protein